MSKQFFNSSYLFCKKHFIVILYFGFFVFAMLPTMVTSLDKIASYYKIAVLIVFAFLLALYIFKKKIVINYRVIFFAFSIFAIFSLYYLFLMPNYYSFTSPNYSYIPGVNVTVSITTHIRLQSVISIFNICFFAVLFVYICPKLMLDKSDLKVFSILFSALLLVVCAFFAFDLIKKGSNASIDSLLQNKNTFGVFLFGGILLCCLSFKVSTGILEKSIYVILLLVFFAFAILSKSTTALLLCAFVLLYFFISIIIFSKSINLWLKIIIVGSFVLIVSAVLASPYIPGLSNSSLGKEVAELYNKIFNSGKAGFERMFSGRGKLWMFGGHIISAEYLTLGHGLPILDDIVYSSSVSYFETKSITNSYLTIINGFGIIGTIFYLGVFALILYAFYKSDSKISDLLLCSFISFMIYGVFETLILFRSNTVSLIVTPIMVVPASMHYFNRNKNGSKVVENEKK